MRVTYNNHQVEASTENIQNACIQLVNACDEMLSRLRAIMQNMQSSAVDSLRNVCERTYDRIYKLRTEAQKISDYIRELSSHIASYASCGYNGAMGPLNANVTTSALQGYLQTARSVESASIYAGSTMQSECNDIISGIDYETGETAERRGQAIDVEKSLQEKIRHTQHVIERLKREIEEIRRRIENLQQKMQSELAAADRAYAQARAVYVPQYHRTEHTDSNGNTYYTDNSSEIDAARSRVDHYLSVAASHEAVAEGYRNQIIPLEREMNELIRRLNECINLLHQMQSTDALLQAQIKGLESLLSMLSSSRSTVNSNLGAFSDGCRSISDCSSSASGSLQSAAMALDRYLGVPLLSPKL